MTDTVKDFQQTIVGDNQSQMMDGLSNIGLIQNGLLDVVRNALEQAGVIEINAQQALLVAKVGNTEVTAGELKSQGFYDGSHVSYNLKKLVEYGYMSHRRCEEDRRSVRVKVTDKALPVIDIVTDAQKIFCNAMPERMREALVTLSGVKIDLIIEKSMDSNARQGRRNRL